MEKEFQLEETKDDEGFNKDLWAHAEARKNSFIVIKLNREGRLHVPRKESYPIPLSYIDVTRSTYADLENAQEKRIYDYWDVDENSSERNSFERVLPTR